MPERDSPDEIARLEARLKRFQPRTVQLDGARLWWESGRAGPPASSLPGAPARSPTPWLWKVTTIAASGVAALLAWRVQQLSHELAAEKPVRERIVYIERQAPASAAASAGAVRPLTPQPDRPSPATPSLHSNPYYLRSRQVALGIGLDALGSPPSPGGEPSSSQRYFDAVQEFFKPAAGSPSTVPGVEQAPGLAPGEHS